ncbi:MAG: histone deacetylase family protein [Rhodospirillaceae bacterium]|nr:histone deacetylase family protein [Rhodospirillaceae bacterium]
MPTVLYSHPLCIEHDPGAGHPERPDRLRATLAALETDAFAALVRRTCPPATMEQIERVHAPDYVKMVFDTVPGSGHAYLDPDTALSPGSGEAALLAAGGVCAAVDDVIGGKATNAYCAVRPPGHHAERDRAMGFCLFNNVAIGAMQARTVHGLERVAVVDFDVHHGNGTQHSFENDAGLFYGSSHQWPAYPGTGDESERGAHNNVVNVTLSPGSGSQAFRAAYTNTIVPALRQWKPDLLMISAGYDGHAADPLANLELHEDDFAWVTRELLSVAAECCKNRVVSVQEGGYDLDSLAASAAAHVRELMAVGENG